MSRHVPNWLIVNISAWVLLAPSVLPQQEAVTSDAKQQATLKLAQQVRREIVMQPLYGVFDYIHFAIQGDTVILRGKASRPTLKSSIENSVKRIEGVNDVKNEIEVLPLSPNRFPCNPHHRRERPRDLDGCGGLGYGSSHR